MFDHIMFYVNKYDEAVQFYDAVLPALGYQKLFETGTGATRKCAYGKIAPQLWIAEGQAGERQLHIALRAEDKNAVDRFHHNALAAGGRDNGLPGYRTEYHPGYYAAFAIDADGNNIEALFHEVII